jgi:hypothetical protein
MSEQRIQLLEQTVRVLQNDVDSFSPAIEQLVKTLKSFVLEVNELKNAQAGLEDAVLQIAEKLRADSPSANAKRDGKEL